MLAQVSDCSGEVLNQKSEAGVLLPAPYIWSWESLLIFWCLSFFISKTELKQSGTLSSEDLLKKDTP